MATFSIVFRPSFIWGHYYTDRYSNVKSNLRLRVPPQFTRGRDPLGVDVDMDVDVHVVWGFVSERPSRKGRLRPRPRARQTSTRSCPQMNPNCLVAVASGKSA